MAALPSLAPSLTPRLHSNLAADIGNISRITKTHKSLSITPKPLPDLKQSMAFEVSAFGVQGRGSGGAGWLLVREMEIQKEKWFGRTVVEVVMEGKARRLKMNTQRSKGGVTECAGRPGEEQRETEGTEGNRRGGRRQLGRDYWLRIDACVCRAPEQVQSSSNSP